MPKNYKPAFKAEVVRLSLDEKRSYAQVSADLEISEPPSAGGAAKYESTGETVLRELSPPKKRPNSDNSEEKSNSSKLGCTTVELDRR